MADRKSNKVTAPRNIDAAEKRLKAVQMRRAGATYEEIARTLGYADKRTAFNLVKAYLRELENECKEGAHEIQMIEIDRLDQMYKVAFAKAKGGDLAAIDRCLRIMERRAKMLGLDAMAKVLTVTPKDLEAMTDDELAALLEF